MNGMCAARFAAVLIAATTFSEPGTAQNARLPIPPAVDVGSLSDLVLPYTPYLFDFAVTTLRSVAEITYTGRRYDPVTRSLVVSGLAVDRDAVHFRVGQMRIASDQLILDDVAFDTRQLPLDETVRQILDKLGRQVVVGNITVGVDVDAPRANYLVQASLRFGGIGAFDLGADLKGFHLLVPLDGVEGAGSLPDGGMPEIRGHLASADLGFIDMGLVAALYDVVGRQQGLNPAAAKGAATLIAGAAVAGVVDKLPGGSSPALQQQSLAWSGAVQAFLKAPDRLSIKLRPQEPFNLARLTDGAVDAADVEALRPSVINGQTARQPLYAPRQLTLAPDAPLADILALADTLLEGRGTPQNAGRALELIMPAAMDGNRAAVAMLARAIDLDPFVPIAQEKLVPAYVALDLALAEGLAHAGESLAAVGSRLSPAEVVGAEDEAVSTWRKTPVGERQRATEIEAFRARDWSTIRRLAFAYYEGTEMPRNIMRAYGWAAIAAAGGDRAGMRLRNELTRAAGSGKLVLPLDQARKATDDLWALILGGDKPAGAPAAGSTPVERGAGDGGAAGVAGATVPSDAGSAPAQSEPAASTPATPGPASAGPTPEPGAAGRPTGEASGDPAGGDSDPGTKG